MLFKYSISGVQFYISLLDTSVLQSLYIVKKICLNKKKKRKNKKKKRKRKQNRKNQNNNNFLKKSIYKYYFWCDKSVIRVISGDFG